MGELFRAMHTRRTFQTRVLAQARSHTFSDGMKISSNPIPMDSSSHSVVVCITQAFALIIDSTFKKCQLQ